MRPVTAKTGWREGNINRCKTWTPLSPLYLDTNYMQQKGNNFAYIDGANLHRGVNSLGWKLDYSTVIVSSDGDYASLVKFLKEQGKLKVILSPHTKDLCSILLKRTGAPIAYLDDQKHILRTQKEKAPDVDKTT